ncbi:hypothetical protein BU23DRAFT_565229 [Bimuria novae-zelandiae CBS 107.79]|uniref:Uncharacterized protein n=1 Tax=Bimuria novae-zelandiae CBS 107.79 TaxID=1447943 RepID=A0A6A5VK61_9PLEO|nr:hypothetical protein BU23DRAFT_565229 [Bimuria novae-zelandiae CBS 107.79]
MGANAQCSFLSQKATSRAPAVAVNDIDNAPVEKRTSDTLPSSIPPSSDCNGYSASVGSFAVPCPRTWQSEISGLDGQGPREVLLPINVDYIRKAEDTARLRRKNYAKLLERGMAYMMVKAYDEDGLDQRSVARTMEKNDFKEIGMYGLLSIHRPALKLTIEGNPLKAKAAPGELYSLYNDEDSPWRLLNSPAICTNYLVDRYQNSPSANDYLRVQARLLSYVSGRVDSVDAALELDNLSSQRNSMRKGILNGQHWYLNGPEHRVMCILTFCEALTKHFAGMDLADRDKPLAKPLSYLDCSINPEKGFKQHEMEQLSSWLHHVVVQALRLEDPSKSYNFQSVIICHLAKEWEPRVMEPVATVLTDCTYETGGGFCIE